MGLHFVQNFGPPILNLATQAPVLKKNHRGPFNVKVVQVAEVGRRRWHIRIAMDFLYCPVRAGRLALLHNRTCTNFLDLHFQGGSTRHAT